MQLIFIIKPEKCRNFPNKPKNFTVIEDYICSINATAVSILATTDLNVGLINCILLDMFLYLGATNIPNVCTILE